MQMNSGLTCFTFSPDAARIAGTLKQRAVMIATAAIPRIAGFIVILLVLANEARGVPIVDHPRIQQNWTSTGVGWVPVHAYGGECLSLYCVNTRSGPAPQIA